MESDVSNESHDAIVLVRSADIDLGPELPNQARSDVARVVGKYFGPLHAASVYISRERRLYRCAVKVEVAEAGSLTSEGSGFSSHEAFGGALRKIAKQLRRRKRELGDRRTASPPRSALVPSKAAN
jgi:ribosome-associated translation inhibitor RaiA